MKFSRFFKISPIFHNFSKFTQYFQKIYNVWQNFNNKILIGISKKKGPFSFPFFWKIFLFGKVFFYPFGGQPLLKKKCLLIPWKYHFSKNSVYFLYISGHSLSKKKSPFLSLKIPFFEESFSFGMCLLFYPFLFQKMKALFSSSSRCHFFWRTILFRKFFLIRLGGIIFRKKRPFPSLEDTTFRRIFFLNL